MKRIDLNKFHQSGNIVMSGRPKGEQIRSELNLDRLDADPEAVEVDVPEEVVSLNNSFFLGLFGPSVRNLGEGQFRSHYKFRCAPPIVKDIDSGIHESLKTSNPLKPPTR